MRNLAAHEISHSILASSFTDDELLAIRFMLEDGERHAIAYQPSDLGPTYAITAAGPAWVAMELGHHRRPYVETLLASPEAVLRVASMASGTCDDDIVQLGRIATEQVLPLAEKHQVMRFVTMALWRLTDFIISAAEQLESTLNDREGVAVCQTSKLVALTAPVIRMAGECARAGIPGPVALQMMESIEVPAVPAGLWLCASPPRAVEDELAASGILIGGVA
jgi:hypothetical protein